MPIRLPTGGDVPFVVLGMGRLGLSEFDLASDADLVFVAGSEAKREDLEHWTHLAEKTIEVLSSYTREGTIFPVDTRLRPRGQEGELVVTLEGLLSYIAEDAQAWELLTYLKAHPLAGDSATRPGGRGSAPGGDLRTGFRPMLILKVNSTRCGGGWNGKWRFRAATPRPPPGVITMWTLPFPTRGCGAV